MIGLVQVGRQAMADRYAYLPFSAFSSWSAGVSAELGRRRSACPQAVLPVASSALIILALCVTTRRQIGYWADNVTLWTHTIQVTPPNYVAQDDLGGALLIANGWKKPSCTSALAAEIHPSIRSALSTSATTNTSMEISPSAIESIQEGNYPDDQSLGEEPRPMTNMGLAYRALGEADQARECFEQAQKLQAQSNSAVD